MSFLAKTPQLTTAQDLSNTSSYKEAEPVPIGYGTDFFASHWLCDAYNWRTAVAGSNKPDWQYCSIAAGYRDGPVDFVGRVKRDGKVIAHLNYTFGPGEESHEFTLNPSLKLGQAWKVIVHRGTADAPASASLIAGTGQNHPPYRGLCWAEWINIDLGGGVTAVPDLQLELGRAAPAIGAYAGGLSAYGVNPFAAAYAILRDATGYELDGAYLDDAAWGDLCTQLEAQGIADRTGNLVHCHPVFKTAQEAANLLSTILAHVDGFLYVDGGKFRAGWFPSQDVNPAVLTEISEADIESAPANGDFPDWNRGASSVVVVFHDRERDGNEAPALCPAAANRETGVVTTPLRQERPMIHDAQQAAMIAAEISAARASAESTITLSVQKSRALNPAGTAPLMPGDLVNWDYGPHSIDLVMRIVGRRMRSGQTADLLELIPERGQFPRPYVAARDDRVLPTLQPPGEIAVVDVRLYMLPSGFGGVRQVTAFVNRAHRGIYRVDVHLSATGGAPWEVVLDSRFFSAKCAVAAAIDAAAGTVRVTSTSVDFSRMSAQTTVGQIDDALLLLLDAELLSVGAITVVAENTYDLAVLRGRRGTVAAGHASAATAFLFLREELQAVEHAEFYRVRTGFAYDAALATKHFKLQLFTPEEDGLAKPDDPGLALQLPDLSPDDSAGYTITLTAEAHTVACAADGTVNAGELGAGGTARTTVKVVRGSTVLAAVDANPNSDQFSASISAVQNCAATKETAANFRADTLTANTGLIEIMVNVAGGFTIPKVFSLTKARAGVAGTVGDPGPGIVYQGAYVAGLAYYHSATRRDVVSYGGIYYLANNLAKNGLTTWGVPGTADWTVFGATFKSVATDLLLAGDATILKTLVMGDGATANAGLIRSAGATAFDVGAGFWLGYAGTTPKFRIGDPAGGMLAWDGAYLTAKFGSGGNVTLADNNKLFFGDAFTNPQAKRFFQVTQQSTGIDLYMQDTTGGQLGQVLLSVHPTYGAAFGFKDVAGNGYFYSDADRLGVQFGATVRLWRPESYKLQTDAIFSLLGAGGRTRDLLLSSGRDVGRAGGITFRNSYWSTDSAAYGAAAIWAEDTGSSGGHLVFATTTNGGGATGSPTGRLKIWQNGQIDLSDESGNVFHFRRNGSAFEVYAAGAWRTLATW